jgi:hypothetical protein
MNRSRIYWLVALALVVAAWVVLILLLPLLITWFESRSAAQQIGGVGVVLAVVLGGLLAPLRPRWRRGR